MQSTDHLNLSALNGIVWKRFTEKYSKKTFIGSEIPWPWEDRASSNHSRLQSTTILKLLNVYSCCGKSLESIQLH